MSKEKQNELLINDVESNNSEVISNRQEWISVDERLPKHGKNVLVYCDRHGIGYDVAYWNEYKKAWFSHYLSFGHNVTHWMPLPEPPMMKGGAE